MGRAEISGESRGDLEVLAVDGELDLSNRAEFRDRFAESVRAPGARAAVVDLSKCSFLDSTGIAGLLKAFEFARSEGVGFAVVLDPEAQPYRVLKLTRCLPNRLPHFATRESAEAALCERPAGAFASGRRPPGR